MILLQGIGASLEEKCLILREALENFGEEGLDEGITVETITSALDQVSTYIAELHVSLGEVMGMHNAYANYYNQAVQEEQANAEAYQAQQALVVLNLNGQEGGHLG
jgi:hypothetical protein